MDKQNDARFEAMMDHYRSEMLRYQRATPPVAEPAAQSLAHTQKIPLPDGVCHSCMTANSAPEVKRRPLPPEEEYPEPAKEPHDEELSHEVPINEPRHEEPPDDKEPHEEPHEDAIPTNGSSIAQSAALPLRWQIFFPDRQRPRPVFPMPRPQPPRPRPPRPQPPRPEPPRPQPPKPQPPRPEPPRPQPQRPEPQRPQPPRPQPRQDVDNSALLSSVHDIAVNAADRLFDTPESDFDTLVFILADKFSSLDENTLTRVLSILARNDPDLAAAVSLAMKR